MRDSFSKNNSVGFQLLGKDSQSGCGVRRDHSSFKKNGSSRIPELKNQIMRINIELNEGILKKIKQVNERKRGLANNTVQASNKQYQTPIVTRDSHYEKE